VVEIKSSLEETLRNLRPDIVVKGKEYQSVKNAELEILKEWGGELVFSSGESTYSGAEFLKNGLPTPEPANFKRPADFARRHDCDHDRLLAITSHFTSLKVVVIGDTIVDEYVTCEALGMSREDPTLVISPRHTDRFLGGAGIVAAHSAALGATTKFFSVTGNDTIAAYVYEQLKKAGVETYLINDDSRPTTLKKRYRCEGKTLLRVSDLRQHEASAAIQDRLLAELESAIAEADVLIFSDFNYGCLPQQLVDKIVQYAKIKGKIIIADSQSSSQVGDISRFKNTNLLTPTEHEARVAMMDNESGLVILAEKLANKTNTKHIFLKLGSEGLLIHSMGDEGWQTDRIEALNQNPKDVAGAGDSLLITSAMSICVGSSIWEAALIGSYAAGLQVSKIGNIPLVMRELVQEFSH
jgi:rfaE bifunctional protein kinase chain/domain